MLRIEFALARYRRACYNMQEGYLPSTVDGLAPIPHKEGDENLLSPSQLERGDVPMTFADGLQLAMVIATVALLFYTIGKDNGNKKR